MTKFRVGDIRPNPFRDLARYPLDPVHVDRLRASIRSTGFWSTVVARKVDGVPEIAFGHYRLEAARQEYGENGRIPLNIEALSDDQMLRMMAEENMEASRNAAEAAHEVVRAVVLAYAEGRVALEPAAQHRGEARCAPSFRPVILQNNSAPTLTYTVSTIVSFLGGTWSANRVQNALTQLAATEANDVPPDVFHDIGPRNAVEVVDAARAASREARQAGMDEERAKSIGREVAVEVADGLREHRTSLQGSVEKMTVQEFRRQAIDARVPKPETQTATPPAYKTAQALLSYVSSFLTRRTRSGPTYADLLAAVADNAGSPSFWPNGPKGVHLDTEIAARLRELAAQAISIADRIDGGRKELNA